MNKLLNKTKKGFTLVELLVVIAILAVLASVSVVGYLGFTTKARNSNAMTELAQVREVLRAELIDGDTNYYSLTEESSTLKATLTDADGYSNASDGFKITYSVASSGKVLTYEAKGTKFVTTAATATSSSNVTWDTLLKAVFTDLKDLKGTIEVVATSGSISNVHYVSAGNASWKVSDDELSSGTYTSAIANQYPVAYTKTA